MLATRWTLLVLSLLAFGCTATPIRYSTRCSARTVIAPATGVYELYRSRRKQPVCNAILLKGDPIGFVRDAQNALVAVAADERHPLSEGEYRWQFEGYGGRNRQAAADHPRVQVGQKLAEIGETAAVLVGGAVIYGALDEAFKSIEEQGLNRRQRRIYERWRQQNSDSDDP